MSIVYRIFPALRLVYCYTATEMTDADIDALRERLKRDPLFNADYDQLTECRHSAPSGVTTHGVIRAANENLFSPASRRALVAVHDSSFGMARMYEQLLPVGMKIQIFRSIDEARQWLGLDAKAFSEISTDLRALHDQVVE